MSVAEERVCCKLTAFERFRGVRDKCSSEMNDDVTIIVDQIGKPKTPRQWKIFSNLTIYVPELEYILALKLFSGRPQDDRNIQALSQRLHIQTQAQAWSIVHAYIPDTQLALRSGYTTQAIGRCFAT